MPSAIIEQLVTKLAHEHPEIKDRAIATLYSKLSKDLICCDDLTDCAGFIQLLLHWINDRQHD